MYSGTENDLHTVTQQTEAHCHENIILFTFQLKRTKITLAAHQCTKKLLITSRPKVPSSPVLTYLSCLFVPKFSKVFVYFFHPISKNI